MNETLAIVVLRPLSFLACAKLYKRRLSLWNQGWTRTRRRSQAATLAFLCFFGPAQAQAFTQVTISSAAPQGTEQAMLSSITKQFQAAVTPNPLVANTYAVKIYGPNPTYNAPPSNQQLLNTMVAVSTNNFVYGFADGMAYQNNIAIGRAGYLDNLCSTATSFMLLYSTTTTFDQATCQDSFGTFINLLFNLSLSTPTPIPGEP